MRLLDSLGAQFPEDGREKSHPLDKRLWRGGRAGAGVGRAGQGQKARTTATSADVLSLILGRFSSPVGRRKCSSRCRCLNMVEISMLKRRRRMLDISRFLLVDE